MIKNGFKKVEDIENGVWLRNNETGQSATICSDKGGGLSGGLIGGGNCAGICSGIGDNCYPGSCAGSASCGDCAGASGNCYMIASACYDRPEGAGSYITTVITQ